MATTPNYGFIMPDPTDYVTDLPADFEIFGDAVDAQIKTVSDAQIPKSIVDAKGDLIAATAADTVARVAVGSNGQVLTANSSATAGVEWVTPTGSVPNLAIPTGQSVYIRVDTGPNSVSGITNFTEDVTYYTPIYVPACTLDRIGVLTGATAATSGNTTRIGIYNNGSDNRPSTVLLDAGTVNPTAASTAYEITISQTITTAGIYWLAFNRQATAGTQPDYSSIGSNRPLLLPFRTSLSTSAPNIGGYQQTGVTGAFATAASLTIRTSDMPVVWLRVA